MCESEYRLTPPPPCATASSAAIALRFSLSPIGSTLNLARSNKLRQHLSGLLGYTFEHSPEELRRRLVRTPPAPGARERSLHPRITRHDRPPHIPLAPQIVQRLVERPHNHVLVLEWCADATPRSPRNDRRHDRKHDDECRDSSGRRDERARYVTATPTGLSRSPTGGAGPTESS